VTLRHGLHHIVESHPALYDRNGTSRKDSIGVKSQQHGQQYRAEQRHEHGSG
jgi:hypothetical protein